MSKETRALLILGVHLLNFLAVSDALSLFSSCKYFASIRLRVITKCTLCLNHHHDFKTIKQTLSKIRIYIKRVKLYWRSSCDIRFIKLFPNLDTLELLCKDSSLPQLAKLNSLPKIHLIINSSQITIKDVWTSNVAYLSFENITNSASISIPSDVEALECLILDHGRFQSLTILKILLKLRRLSLQNCANLTSITFLSNMPNLTHLNLLGTNIYDVRILSHLNRLEVLNLKSCARISPTDTDAISPLTELQHLNMSYTPIASITSFSSLIYLKSLNLEHTDISDISALKHCRRLQNLYLSGTNLDSIAALSTCVYLKALHVEQTRVSDLSPLIGMKLLSDLRISWTRVWDLSPISRLIRMENIEFDGTLIPDINGLKELQGLQAVRMVKSGVCGGVDILSGLTRLRSVHVDREWIETVAEDANFVNITSKVKIE